MLLYASLLLAVSPASAASCDAMLAKVGSLAPEAVAGAYGDLLACDRKLAEANFNKYLEKATDADALVGLVVKAIDGDVWNPAWLALGKISSYDARDEVARRVGESCTTDTKVETFLQGAYSGLRNVEFTQWDDGLLACSSDKLWAWADGVVAAVPAKQFDEKYSSLVGIYVKHKRVDALPTLVAATTKAAEIGGPFDDLLQHMGDSVAPELGQDPDPEQQAKLVEALVSVAQKVPVEQARDVANQLANAGAEGPAASLLPKLYPDRVQGGGGFLYAVGAMEAGDCDGKKTAVLHYTTASEPGKRWTILGDLEPLMRASKAKLKGCTMEGPWPVMHSPEPIKSAAEADVWSAAIVKEWADKGYDVKTQKEKSVALP